MSQAAATTNNDIGYQNYFSFAQHLINNTNGIMEASHQEKRKLIAQPCVHCLKAHLSCDGGRPCQGCMKRDLSNTCSDVVRKRSKPNNNIVDNTTPPSKELFSSPTTTATTSNSDNYAIDTSQLFNFSLTDLEFGSETTGLEYGILGNMLVDLPPTPTTDKYQQPLFAYNNNDHSSISPTTVTTPILYQQSPPLMQQHHQPVKLKTNRRKGNSGNTPEAVYNSVKKPFNYAEGFHYLIQYVTDKMAREDLMRISKSLSLFRPSFLSLIMNLTEEDLIFMERCIQRTLLEYEKLISFSGTPTVVWRRTGEITLVGKEFSLLTLWTRDMLLNKKTYIYELMENQSAVEYWEKFSTHAFDNTEKACSYSCILKTPQQKPVPCTFCFTIKRDIFDLPSVIVGNFLPILS